jgi:hypothetical protein
LGDWQIGRLVDYDRENRDIRADAECDRQHGNDGDNGRPRERPDGDSETMLDQFDSLSRHTSSAVPQKTD